MYTVVGVRFKKAGKIYYFDPSDMVISKNEYVIVETARGIEYGEVIIGNKVVNEEEVVLPLKKVLRMGNEDDALVVQKNKLDAKETFYVCQEKIKKHELDMKLIDVEYTFDRNKIIFYFTAEGRVDFRELVKDLAAVFKTRIELRKIGVRDEAKMLGGIGQCGRVLCCTTFLGDFDPVSIKMAKDQKLSLNPIKISGLCSRLMCCLKYENDNYESENHKEKYPGIGSKVLTSLGVGKVVGIDTSERGVRVKLEESDKVEIFPLEEIVEGDIEF